MRIPQHTASFTAPPGGVMTREVGAITGDVEAWLDERHPGRVHIRYAEAEDVYTVSGRAQGLTLDEVVGHLQADPGLDADGNPASTSLADRPATPARAPQQAESTQAPQPPEPAPGRAPRD